jgi:hypothetical protein
LPESERRARFSFWVTHPENPLFWRSSANRLWLRHFGQGIVDTPNDFGRMGSLPSHPELLDWLACALRDRGSVKAWQRMVVTSHTYRQVSSGAAGTEAIDPDNRLLGRGVRQRLDAESFRDSLLRLASTLDFTLGGPAVQWFRLGPAIQVTPSVDYAHYDWSCRDGHRRSIYRFVYRGQQDPFMEALDFPDAAQLTPARSLSASPLQSLALWNHDFVLQACLEIEASILADRPVDPVSHAFQLLFHRLPTVQERTDCERLVQRSSLAELARVLVNSNEFLFGD